MAEKTIPMKPQASGALPASVTAGRRPVITEESVRKAGEILNQYRQGKQNLDSRMIENANWWKRRHWMYFKDKPKDPERIAHDLRPTSAWLFNSVINKHADMMDNFPEANILPREEDDEEVAKALTSIVPVILERNGFEQTYSECAWDKLKKGTGIYGVFWNNSLSNGLGDIDVRKLDMLHVFWEPGITDIQDSRNLFILDYWDNDLLTQLYPALEGKLGGTVKDSKEYLTEDQVDRVNKSIVVDWYYKRSYGGKTILHYVKYCANTILYASENDQQYIRGGYYEHGMYPVVFDTLFSDEETPGGFGYIDIMKSPQEYIDRMDAAFLKNTLWGSRPRYFFSDGANVNAEEFSDMDRDFVSVAGSIDDTKIRKIEAPSLPGAYLNVRQAKIDELKETSGNRDFSQGATVSGVTAASAIAALQEAGSKTSRDLNKGSYRAFTQVCTLVIECIRQFYTEQRAFRILGTDTQARYVHFDNRALQPVIQGESFGVQLASRMPVFDIKIRPQKSSPFSRLSQNELALQLYAQGAFNPELADQAQALVEMMDFEGKDKVLEKITNNGTLLQKLRSTQEIALKTADLLAQATGDTRIRDALIARTGADMAPGSQAPGAAAGAVSGMETDAYGQPLNDRSMAGKAREKAQKGAAVK